MAEQFWVVAADGKEYGPVPLETLILWVREGRVVPTTRIRRDDGEPAEARTFPELAGPLGEGPSRPGEPPSTALAPARVTGPAEFRVWDIMGQAWTLVKPHWLPLSAMFFVMSALAAFPSLGGMVWFIIGGPIMVGIWRAQLGLVDGRTPTVGMMFEGFDRFGDAFLAALVTGILISLGTLCFIVPGIILAILWTFTYPIIGETKLGFWEAMHRSAVLTEGYRWRLFLLALACLLVLILGLLGLCIGVFLALPVCYTAFALAYRFLQKNKQPASARM